MWKMVSVARKNILPIAETFDRIAFDTLLAKQDCVRIRLYYGMDETFKIHAIIVGVDATGADILATQVSGAALEGDGDIVEDGQRCPQKHTAHCRDF